MAGGSSEGYRRSCALIAGLMLAFGILSVSSRQANAVSLLVEAESGYVIAADAANHLWYPASLTKIMTIYIALAEIKAGRLSFDDDIIVSRSAAGVSPIRFGLVAGQKITVRQAINAAIVASANDAAVALAEKIAGTEESFADMMTLAARRLGMTRTTFRNATGLPNSRQLTTAHDMAILAMAILRDYPEHYALFNQRSVTIAGKSRPTVNGILGAYEGADGFKTGFTCGSGYNLVASAMRGNRRVIGVVLGSESRQKRQSEMIKLLDMAFKHDTSVDVPLTSLILDPADEGKAPTVLTGISCTVPNDGDINIPAADEPNWRLMFGSYADKAKAQMALADVRRRFVLAENVGMMITPKVEYGATRYSALVTGIPKSVAGRACEALSTMKVVCHAAAPDPVNKQP